MREEVRPGRREGVGGGGDAIWVCTKMARLKAVGARARAEHTLNIHRMHSPTEHPPTLDVSKLSGWLNADADCRVERRACDAGRGKAREA